MPSILIADPGTLLDPIRSHRSPIFAASLAVHAVLLTTAAIASLATQIDLPVLHRRVSYIPARPIVMAADIPLPSRASAAAAPRTESPVALLPAIDDSPPREAAPVVAATGVAEEIGLTGVGLAQTNLPGLAAFAGWGRGGTSPDGNGSGGASTTGGGGTAAASRAPVRLHSGVRPPERLAYIEPVYPALALRARIEGLVSLEVVIDEHGNVGTIRVIRSTPMLDASAVDAVRQWRYKPAILSGTPMAVLMTVSVRFELNR